MQLVQPGWAGQVEDQAAERGCVVTSGLWELGEVLSQEAFP